MTGSAPRTGTPEPEHGEVPVLEAPREGLPGLIDTPEELARRCADLAAGHGPVAIDTERAHGFRYSPQAWLIQLRRAGAGTLLVDPRAFGPTGGEPAGGGLEPLARALRGTEWILHAASQDMPCLAMEGLRPDRLFDTELAGRLLGLDHVGLAAMVEDYLGVRLLKEHSAADWSTRPLPEDWLVYAALDVELLDELRAAVAEDLRVAGKIRWAREEFDHLVDQATRLPTGTPPPDPHRWRRTTGIGQVRTRAGLQVLHDLWWAREEIAAATDTAPGRIVNDRALTGFTCHVGDRVDLTESQVRSSSALGKGRGRRHLDAWLAAVDHAASVRPRDLPPLRAPRHPGEIPHPRSWSRHHPQQAARWEALRPTVNGRAAELHLPPENLLAPAVLRELAWQPPRDVSAMGLDAWLAEREVRQWQRDLVCGALSRTLSSHHGP